MTSVHLQKCESKKETTTFQDRHKVEMGEDNRMVLQAKPEEEVGLQVEFDSDNRVLRPIEVPGYASNVIDAKLGKETKLEI